MRTPIFCILGFLIWQSCTQEPMGGVVGGTNWRLKNISVPGETRILTEGAGIVLSFHSNKISGIAGCNDYFGDYSVEGAKLEIRGIGANRSLCPGKMELEKRYLDLLENAGEYSVHSNQLKVFSEKGQLTFERLTPAEEADLDRRRKMMSFDQLFASDLSQQPLHLFAVEYPNEKPGYPFLGTEVPYELFDLFDQELAASWQDLGWGVFAVGKYHGAYLLRIPGRYTSDQIALYRIRDGKMQYLASVASRWCDEGWCNQQDGWLRDLNDDGRFDLITRYVQFDEEGEMILDELKVQVQSSDGEFIIADQVTVNKEDFPMKQNNS